MAQATSLFLHVTNKAMSEDKKTPTTVGSENDQLITEITKTANKLYRLRGTKEFELRLEAFLKMLNEHPPQSIIQQRGNYYYTPISYVEATLDRLYLGLWEAKNFQWTTHANEMVGSVDLSVYHPVAEKWITRTGAAAIAVRQAKDSKVEEFFQTKIKNALEMDFPHLLADCTKNAANKFGVVFGRDLNRKVTDEYSPLLTKLDDKLADTLSELLKAATADGIDVDKLLKEVKDKK